MKQTQIFQMRTNPADREMIRVLAEVNGVSSSDVVRLLVRRAYAEVMANARPKRADKRSARKDGGAHGR